MVIFIILPLCFLCDCKNKKLIIERQEIIEIKSAIDFYPNINYLLELKSDTILFQFDWRNNEMYLIKNSNIIKYKDKVNNFIFAFTNTEDSIYALDRKNGNVSIFNSKFDSIGSYVIPRIINNSFYTIFVNSSSNFIEYNKKLYLSLFPNGYIDSFYTKNYELVFSLENKEIEKVYMKFPDIYKSNNWWSITGNKICKTINNKNEIIYMFPMYDNIFIMKNEKIKEVKLQRSKYLKNFPPKTFDNEVKENKYIFEYSLTVPYYHSFHYDKYRDLYYRIVIHEQELSINGVKNTHESRNWSIMIFDNEFNFLDEVFMKRNLYHFNYFFIFEEGLYFVLQNKSKNKQQQIQRFKVLNEK